MTYLFFAIILFTAFLPMQAQVFKRSELPTTVTVPWEITYGADNFLWVTELGGIVSRVDPSNGTKTIVYTAPDYFAGSLLEQSQLCIKPKIGYGTLGLALHPDFTNSATSYIYYVYSYNSGSEAAPSTKFKIKRLKWDAVSSTVTHDTDLVLMITSGNDHLGGRLMAVKQNNVSYLFLAVGDHGISDVNYPDCYQPQTTNPNNFAQDPATQNGKIHRFNIDGSIPADNPISGNSFYTRGHRNPQGLMYNPSLDIMYDIEHGDRTDDEINILQKGMNYGWKTVRGYHDDNNYPGEVDFVKNYAPNKDIAGDALIEPFYSFCTTNQDTASNYETWCTVAPSDGIYYGSTGIPEWTNSLLVVTLKNGVNTDLEVYQFKLENDGKLAPSTSNNPNPKRFFGEDQAMNGRLRDITFSPDGRTIYLVNNYGNDRDRITVYTYDSLASGVDEYQADENIHIYPNPTMDFSNITYTLSSPVGVSVKVFNLLGEETVSADYGMQDAGQHTMKLETEHLQAGIYLVRCEVGSNIRYQKFIIAR